MSTEPFAEQLERLTLMADEGSDWDLSDNDRAAIAAVLSSHADLFLACKEFVRKCECGEARSVRSYAQMKAAILNVEARA